MGVKKRVIDLVESCYQEISGMPTTTTLNILSLCSYDILIGMDWLETSRTKDDYYGKLLEFLRDEGKEKYCKA